MLDQHCTTNTADLDYAQRICDHFDYGNTFGERLRLALICSGTSMKSLGEQIGITTSAVSAFVNGRADPSLKTAIDICKALHISLDWLAGIKEHSNIATREEVNNDGKAD